MDTQYDISVSTNSMKILNILNIYSSIQKSLENVVNFSVVKI